MPERDPMTFETRLTDAFAAYTAAAPLDVDPRALAAELARSGRTRRLGLPTFNLARSGGVRLALVLGLLALASVAGLLFAGGFLRSAPAPLGGGGRLLVWLPSGVNSGTAHLLGSDGVERASRGMESRGCPTLLGSADGLAIRGYGVLRFESFAEAPRGEVSTNYAGFERWSDNHQALAAVDSANGPATVVTFPDGDVANPRFTRYAIKGALEGSFSPDGSRLVIPIRSDASSIALHLLQGGTDTMLATVPALDATQTAAAPGIAWAPDGSAFVVATTGTDGEGLARVGLDGSVTQVLANGTFAAGTSLRPMVWTGGIYVIAHTDGGEVWELDVMRHSAHDTGVRLTPGVPAEARLAPSGYGVAIITGSTLTVHWFDREPQDRVIDLPGSEATFSPDGTQIASVGGDAKAAVSVWLTDPWATTAPTQVATLPVATALHAEPATTYCIQWLPEVRQ